VIRVQIENINPTVDFKSGKIFNQWVNIRKEDIMTTIQDRVADMLYPETGPTTVDIKVSHGGRSADDICRMILQGLTHVQSGRAVLVTDLTGY
jgi:hypothetical protein